MDIILKPKKNIIFDATVLTSLMGCGLFTDLRYNQSFHSLKGSSNSLETGLLSHKVLEVFYKLHGMQHMERNMAIGHALTAGQLFITGCPHCSQVDNLKPACGHSPLEYPGVKNTPEKNDGTKYIGWKWVLETCEQYFDFYKNDSWITLGVEFVKGEVLYEDDEIRILWKSKIDWLIDSNNGIFSTDHKTMKQRREKLNLNNQFMGQAIVTKQRTIILNKIGFQTTLEPKEKFTREMVSFSADRILEWQSEILPYYGYKYIQYQESGYWPPNWTHCENVFGKCIFSGVCQADRGMREEEIKMNFFVGPKWNPGNINED